MHAFLLDAQNIPYSEALGLLAIGMITIFIVLSLVVLSGNILIHLSNRFLSPTSVEGEALKASAKHAIPSSTLAAIVAAVEIHTGGKGSIQSIKKI
ncbi:MAG: OadG family protein [Bacteroidota bacterium]